MSGVTAGAQGIKYESDNLDKILIGGAILGIIGVGYVLWKAKETAEDIINAPIEAAGAVLQAGKEAIQNEENRATQAARGVQSQYIQSGGIYTALPEIQAQDRFWTTQPKDPAQTFTQFTENLPAIPAAAVKLGSLESSVLDAITGYDPLTQAAQAGAEFRVALEQNNDVERFEALSSAERALVTIGEALPRTFIGVSPYEAGQQARSWWDSLW
ncbi:MAG: hypothetical protein PHH85_03520 [Candidatus Methanoperedens sp.]|nr:hypothetical protein [Candidatus Methanoperedens sp.]